VQTSEKEKIVLKNYDENAHEHRQDQGNKLIADHQSDTRKITAYASDGRHKQTCQNMKSK
jgi:hypothetical protein